MYLQHLKANRPVPVWIQMLPLRCHSTYQSKLNERQYLQRQVSFQNKKPFEFLISWISLQLYREKKGTTRFRHKTQQQLSQWNSGKQSQRPEKTKTIVSIRSIFNRIVLIQGENIFFTRFFCWIFLSFWIFSWIFNQLFWILSNLSHEKDFYHSEKDFFSRFRFFSFSFFLLLSSLIDQPLSFTNTSKTSRSCSSADDDDDDDEDLDPSEKDRKEKERRQANNARERWEIGRSDLHYVR